jgi:hypothetical protein
LILASCSSSAPIKPVLQECDKPELVGDTYRDLIEAYLRRGEAIDVCNAGIRKAME